MPPAASAALLTLLALASTGRAQDATLVGELARRGLHDANEERWNAYGSSRSSAACTRRFTRPTPT